jgi:hypothetical protein
VFSRSWEHDLDERERAFMAKFVARELGGSGDVDLGKERGGEREGVGVSTGAERGGGGGGGGGSTGAESHRQRQRESEAETEMEAETHAVTDREGGEGGGGRGEAEDVRAWLLRQNEQLRDRLRKKEREANSTRPKLETTLERFGEHSLHRLEERERERERERRERVEHPLERLEEDTLHCLASANTLQRRKLELVERERALKAKELDLKEVEMEEREIERRHRELDDWERALMAKELDLKGRAVLDFKRRAVSDYRHEVLAEESAIQRRERELEERERALRAKELDFQEGSGSLDRSRSLPPSLTLVGHSQAGEVEDPMFVAAALRAKELDERERAIRGRELLSEALEFAKESLAPYSEAAQPGGFRAKSPDPVPERCAGHTSGGDDDLLSPDLNRDLSVLSPHLNLLSPDLNRDLSAIETGVPFRYTDVMPEKEIGNFGVGILLSQVHIL